MRFAVTILGTGTAMPTLRRHHSAQVLNIHEQYYLVDCGEGTQSRLLEQGINPIKISAVFISHMHGDHIFGLMPLIFSMAHMGRGTPLTIFAPYPMADVLEFHLSLFDAVLPFEIAYKEVNTRENTMIYENKVLEVRTIPLRHRVPSAGYLFREKEPPLNIRKEAIERYGLGIAQIAAAKQGKDLYDKEGKPLASNVDITYRPYSSRSFAYCSDTQYSGKVAALVAGTDLLYHEATFAEAEKDLAKKTGHSTATQAAKTALLAGVGKLLLGHISSRYKDESLLLDEAKSIFPDTEIAEEGRTYEIPLKRND